MVTINDYKSTEREVAVREGKKGFFVHAVVFTFVMAGLILLNLVLLARNDDGVLWFPFPLVGWASACRCTTCMGSGGPIASCRGTKPRSSVSPPTGEATSGARGSDLTGPQTGGIHMKPGRIVALIIGLLLLLPGLGLLLSGGGLAVAYAVARDDEGYVSADLERVQSSSVAVTAEDADFGVDGTGPDWLFEALDVDLRVRVVPANGQAAFVGIARAGLSTLTSPGRPTTRWPTCPTET